MSVNMPYFMYPVVTDSLTNGSYANIPYMPFLPTATFHLGGDTQVVTMPEFPGTDNSIQFNPIAAGILGMSNLNPWNCVVPPSSNPAWIQAQSEAILGPIYNQQATQMINTAISNLDCMKTRLESKRNESTTSDEDKKKIDELLKKVADKKKEVEDLKNSTNLTPADAFKKANELTNEINDLAKEVTAILTGTTTPVTSTPGTSTPGTSTPGTSTPGTSTPGTSTPGTSTPGTSTPSTSTPSSQGASKLEISQEIKDDVDELHDAMYGLGTDDATMEAVLSKINKDNVLEYMAAWAEAYPNDESLMEAFMADASSGFLGFGMQGGQKIKYGKHIARALRDRAKEMGVDISEDLNKINKEMNSWFYVNNSVADNYNNIIKKLIESKGGSYEFKTYSMT